MVIKAWGGVKERDSERDSAEKRSLRRRRLEEASRQDRCRAVEGGGLKG